MHTLNFEEWCMYTHLPAVTSFTHVIHSPPPPSSPSSPLSLSQLFNTAVTRAKEWLVVCGEPVTLCTVGSNRLCWVELIKKCLRDLDSFEYPNAARFEALLQTKLFTRYFLLVHTPACPYVFVAEKVCFISQVPRWNILPYKKHCVRM